MVVVGEVGRGFCKATKPQGLLVAQYPSAAEMSTLYSSFDQLGHNVTNQTITHFYPDNCLKTNLKVKPWIR